MSLKVGSDDFFLLNESRTVSLPDAGVEVEVGECVL